MRIRWRVHLLALVTFTLWALVLTWPLLARISTHVPGNGADDPPLTWNLWWVRHALLELGANPFQCSYLFYPIGINLAFYTLTLLNGLLSVPLQACIGLVTTSNLLLLSSFVLGGYGAFLLVAYLLRAGGPRLVRGTGSVPRAAAHAAALAAGLLYAFASSKLFYAALGQWNIASSQWIPFYVLYLSRTGDSPGRLRYPVMAGLFLVLQAYAELTFASFLVLFTLLWAAWHSWGPWSAERRRQVAKLAASLTVIGLLAMLGLLPALANMLPDMLAEGDVFAEGGGFADVFSADLTGFLVPTSLHPVFGELVERLHFPHDVGQHLYPGYAVLFLSAVGAVCWPRRSRHLPGPPAATGGSSAKSHSGTGEAGVSSSAWLARTARFWSLSALAWWLFTLGPTLRINGHDTGIPLPFRLVEELPFFKGNRYPSRYSVLLTLSLAVLAGLGVAALLASSRRQKVAWRAWAMRLAAPLLVILALFEHLSAPLPLSGMEVPRLYEEIAATMPGDWTLLDIPVAWRNGSRVTGTLDTVIMFEQYFQVVHGKRVLAGNTSRNPPLKFQYFSEAPVISTLIALETGHDVPPELVARDQALAPDVLRFLGVQAIVVHPTQAGTGVIPYLESTMPVTQAYQDGEITEYLVTLPSWPGTWTVTPGEELSRMSYAEGWGAPTGGWIWAQRKRARLLVPMDGLAQTMSFGAFAPGSGQVISIVVNGEAAGDLSLQAGAHRYSVEIPTPPVREGLNEVVLEFGRLWGASEAPCPLQQHAGQTAFDSPVSITVQSAGNEVGDFGLVYVDGKQVSPNRRGYNVVVLDAQTGSVEDTAAFDTHLDAAASQAMAHYLMQVPAGRLVAIAAADEASRLLGPEAIQALRGIGAAGDLQDKFRWGHAIIGVQGAAAGTALEAMDWIQPVTLAIGTGATEPRLAAGFATITFSSIGPRP